MRTSVALLALLLAAPAAADPSVLVVGDSLEVGTGPHLERELPGRSVTVDAIRGRPSPEGVDVLRSRLRHDDEIVVFDLGTNDDPGNPGLLTSDLAAARGIAGRRCMVVATIARPPLNGVSFDALNQVIEAFASRDANARLADWHAQTVRDPGLVAGDGIHPGNDGYARRARLVADAVRSCGRAGEGGPAQRGSPSRLDVAVGVAARAAFIAVRGVVAALSLGAGRLGGGASG